MRFLEERQSFDMGKGERGAKSTIFISRDYLMQSQIASKLESQFFLNFHEAQPRDFFDMASSLCHLVKGGTPQFWRLISRELVKGRQSGDLSDSDIQKLVELRLNAKS